MVSPGILAPHRWGSLIRLGAHPRVPGIIKHCLIFFFFFFEGRMRAKGIVGRTRRSYSLRGWRPCSVSKLYFSPFSSTFITSLARYSLNNLHSGDPGLARSLFLCCRFKFTAVLKNGRLKVTEEFCLEI